MAERTWLEEHLELTADNAFFWESGHRGELRIQACDSCRYLIHPPAPYCPQCMGREVSPQVVSGRATLYSYTVLVHGAGDGPLVVGIVELEEQSDLQLMTNLVGIAPDEVRIGMALQVTFRSEGAVSVPMFEPLGVKA